MTADENNNNFNEFEIEWNYHNKIRVYKEVISELENTFSYKVECTTIVEDGQPGLSSQVIININIGYVHYKWTYTVYSIVVRHLICENFFDWRTIPSLMNYPKDRIITTFEKEPTASYTGSGSNTTFTVLKNLQYFLWC